MWISKLVLAVNVAPVTDTYDLDEHRSVLNRVENAIITNADAVRVLGYGKLAASGRPRVSRQRFHALKDT